MIYIRSQNKKNLVIANNLETDKDVVCTSPKIIFVYGVVKADVFALGWYKTEERVIEILDEIQKLIQENTKGDYVYQMPKE